MRTLLVFGVAVAALAALGGGEANAGTIDLWDYGVNVNGVVAYPLFGDTLQPEVDVSGFDDFTGLGDIVVSFTAATAGLNYVGAFYDIELDQAENTFFDEFGDTSGSLAAGQTWEIDFPDFGLPGGIYDNFEFGLLDNSNALPAGSEDDVSFAMGWDMSLAAGDSVEIVFTTAERPPASGFYLAQYDNSSTTSVFLSSTLEITRVVTPTPGGSTIPLPSGAWMGMALLAGLGGFRRWRRRDS